MNRAPRHQRNSAYSLVEVLMVVAILGILSALVIDAGIRDWRREQVNTVVVELAGWLESVRRAALKGSSCRVTLNSGSLAPGATLASAAPLVSTAINNPCRSDHTITSLTANQRFVVSSTASTLTFTPAGTLYPVPQTPVVIRVALADGSDPERCVQLEGLLGLISVGRSSGNSCDPSSRF
jgi:prepilin-type N-terminal cleavage/methylation domain-containing protein